MYTQIVETFVFIEVTLYFKIYLHKLISKYLVFGRPALLSHCFKNNFKLISSVCKENADLLFQMLRQLILLSIPVFFNFFSFCREDFFPIVRNSYLLWGFLLIVRISYLLWEYLTCCENIFPAGRISYPLW